MRAQWIPEEKIQPCLKKKNLKVKKMVRFYIPDLCETSNRNDENLDLIFIIQGCENRNDSSDQFLKNSNMLLKILQCFFFLWLENVFLAKTLEK
jgi:hypothetical protein